MLGKGINIKGIEGVIDLDNEDDDVDDDDDDVGLANNNKARGGKFEAKDEYICAKKEEIVVWCPLSQYYQYKKYRQYTDEAQ